ncbi:MAG: membrane protein insertion efficiency factor YidD [Byssovorax sp.]
MITTLLLAAIRLYQLTLSRVLVALFGPACRFSPSCSHYAMACIQGQGPVRGSLLSLKRLCKCHPFHPGGYDPPPPPRPDRLEKASISVSTSAARGARQATPTPGAPGGPSEPEGNAASVRRTPACSLVSANDSDHL